jgi:hypothetical protein
MGVMVTVKNQSTWRLSCPIATFYFLKMQYSEKPKYLETKLSHCHFLFPENAVEE